MSIITHRPNFGDLYSLDMRSRFNYHNIKPEFHNLKTDNIDKYRKINIVKLKYQNKQFIQLNNSVIINSHQIKQLLDFFVGSVDLNDDSLINLQFKRIICNDNLVGLPSPKDWQKYTKHKAIMCISRENIKGGINQFLNDDNELFATELYPGSMLLFKNINHRTTPIIPYDFGFEGHRDILTIYSH